ncbi:MAG: hypothetical protein KGL43_24405 [Burkholderiales bacterium]|nr:hypothetical protein [Burkholderiales bacterium]MDE2398400.1 hypothetical protein [Burkholderiales bacterium]MDE2456743.1 hypothetical protein [Burkholderiales bacterium]
MNSETSRGISALIPAAPDRHISVLLICALLIAFGLIAILVSAWNHHRSGARAPVRLSAEMAFALLPCLMAAGLVWSVVRAAVVAA